MDLSQKNKRKLESPSVITWLILFFFFVLPMIPIVIALISDSTNPNLSGGLGCFQKAELTEEGKEHFKGKEELVNKYLIASNQFQVPWEYLAAIHQIESNFATTMTPQTDDHVTPQTPIEELKVGPMGFLERNWVGWGDDKNDFFATYPGARTARSEDGDLKNSFHSTIVDLNVIKKYKGVGVDGNGDGKADPYNVDDAIFSAANKLKKDGMDKGKIQEAISQYNRQVGYYETVKKKAEELIGYVKIPPCSEQVPTGSIKSMIDEAFLQYRNRTIKYIYGADNYPTFDCSSWVKYMYKKHLGIQLPRTTFTQIKEGTHVPKNQLQPGDLLFFGFGSPTHVGMYVGNGMMIHNARTGKDLQYDSINDGYYLRTYIEGRRYTPADSIK